MQTPSTVFSLPWLHETDIDKMIAFKLNKFIIKVIRNNLHILPHFLLSSNIKEAAITHMFSPIRTMILKNLPIKFDKIDLTECSQPDYIYVPYMLSTSLRVQFHQSPLLVNYDTNLMRPNTCTFRLAVTMTRFSSHWLFFNKGSAT